MITATAPIAGCDPQVSVIAPPDASGGGGSESVGTVNPTVGGGDPGGPTVLWAERAGASSTNEQAHALAVRGEGTSVMVGTVVTGQVTNPVSVFLDDEGNTTTDVTFVASDISLATDVAIDSAGDAIVVGAFHGTIDLGDGPVTSKLNGKFFITKLARDGSAIWARTIDSGVSIRMMSVHVDDVDDIIVAAPLRGSVTLPGGTMLDIPEGQLTLVAIDGATGNATWNRNIGDATPFGGVFTAPDPTGDGFVVCTTLLGDSPLGEGVTSQDRDVLVAKLDGEGNPAWVRSLGGPGNQRCSAVDVSADGGVAFSGRMMDVSNFGGADLMPSLLETMFVVTLDAEGNHTFSRGYASGRASSRSTAVRFGSNGMLYVGGDYTGELDFGAGPLPNPSATSGDIKAFIVGLDPAGEPAWHHVLHGDGGAHSASSVIDVDDAGDVYWGGSAGGELTIGGFVLNAPSDDFFLVKLRP